MKTLFGVGKTAQSFSLEELSKQKKAFLDLLNLIKNPRLRDCFLLATKEQREHFSFNREERINEPNNVRFGERDYLELESFLTSKKEEVCSKDNGKQSKIKSNFIDAIILNVALKADEAKKLQSEKEVLFAVNNALLTMSRHNLSACFLSSALRNVGEVQQFILNEQEREIIRLAVDHPKTYSVQEYQAVMGFLNEGSKVELCGTDETKKSFFDNLLASVQKSISMDAALADVDKRFLRDGARASQTQQAEGAKEGAISSAAAASQEVREVYTDLNLRSAIKQSGRKKGASVEKNAQDIVDAMQRTMALEKLKEAVVPNTAPTDPRMRELEERLGKLKSDDRSLGRK